MFLSRYIKHSLKYLRIKNVLNSQERAYNDIASEDIPEVSTALIKKTFRQNTLNFEEGFTSFLIPCKFCQKEVKSAKIYINKTTGMYLCGCGKETGQWKEFLSLITKSRKKDFLEQRGRSKTSSIQIALEELRNNTTELKLLNQEAISIIFEHLNLPVVSSSVLEHLDIRIDKTHSNLYFPIENVESDVVGYRKISNSKEDTIVPNLICGGVLTSRTSTKFRDTAVLVPNVADFLVLLNAKLSVSVVCLPNGVNNLSQYCLPSLERFKKLIIWFGNTNQDWDAARHFAGKLGEKRCLLVRPSDKQKLPHLDIRQDFKSIIAGAQQMWHKSITTFSALRADVYSDLLNIDKVQGIKWKRFPTLNKILKGHRRGELTVITGPTGSGKTTFISEYSLDLAFQGVNTLWGSFEIRNARLAKTMLQQMAGFPLDEHLHLFDSIADKFEKLPIYFMTFHGQQSITVVMEAVEHATYIHDIAHVIIDNVQFMLGTSEEHRYMDRFWKQDLVIAAFRQFATRKNCHVTLVIHPRKERDEDDLTTSSIFGGAKASQEADNVLIIQDKRLTSLRGKKYLQVAKNRYSGDLGVLPLDFDKAALSFQQKRSKPKKVEEETQVLRSDKDEGFKSEKEID